MKRFIFPFSVLLFAISVFSLPAFAADFTDYPFQKNIALPSQGITQPVQFLLDEDVLNAINRDARNLHVFDDENNTVPYDLYFSEAKRIKDLEVLHVSSNRDHTPLSTLVDNDALTSFNFLARDGAKENPAKVLIDLKSPRPLSRVNIFDSAGPRIDEVLIRGGYTKDNLKTLVPKRPYDYKYDFSSDPVQFVELYLWGRGIVVDDIRVYAAPHGAIGFVPKLGRNYRLLYGDPHNKDITFYEKIPTLPEGKKATLSPQMWNSFYPEDVDTDGIINKFDNCPFLSNPRQLDNDDDHVGNECDNTIYVKNTNQKDTDMDGVGDVLDNCKLTYNPKQHDQDGDGMGDECDNAHTTQDVLSESVSPVTLSLILIVFFAGFLIFQWYRTHRSQSHKKV